MVSVGERRSSSMANQGEQGARCSAVISRGPGSSALLKGKKRHSQEVWDVSCLLGKGREGKTNTHTLGMSSIGQEDWVEVEACRPATDL